MQCELIYVIIGQTLTKLWKEYMKLEIEVTDNKDYKEIVEGMSFKKIIKSVQNKVDKGTKVLYVKYKNKKGTEINRAVDIPIGRKKKLNG